MGKRFGRYGAVTVAAGALVLPMAAPASAAATVSAPLVSGLTAPLGLTVSHSGTVFVSQDGRGTVMQVLGDRLRTVVAAPKGLEIAGIDVSAQGVLSYTVDRVQPAPQIGFINQWRPNGRVSTVGSPTAFEHRVNPDHSTLYGFTDLSKACAAKAPHGMGYPYPGIVDSHPYGVESLADGSVAVADAAGNDIVRVSHGRVSLIAVLPPSEAVVTAAAAAAFHIPKCAIGHSYGFESVPTDVEMGPNGLLYVSTLPGGPEAASPFGARGSVYTVNPRNGAVRMVATGFAGATNLAVSPNGTVYVAELFGNRISKVHNGHPVAVASVNQPAALDYANGKLYATINALVPKQGEVVTVTP